MIRPLGLRAFAVIVSLATASCGGGGGGGGSPTPGAPGIPGTPNAGQNSSLKATFSTDALTFSAKSPFEKIALTQDVTATVTAKSGSTVSGTLYVLVEVPANSFFTVPEARVNGPDAGYATVKVADPQELGAGTYDSSFRVRLCLGDPDCGGNSEIVGSPHTITVHYFIDDVLEGNTVTPHAVTAGVPGQVILRGRNFSASTTVRLGGVSPTSVTYVNSTELKVAYPAMAAGTYSVTLNAGAVPFSGTLVVVPQTNYSYAWIPHQSSPSFVYGIVYDPERTAITFALYANGSTRLLRYQYSAGVWTPAGDADGSNITQLHMSHDGSKIAALRYEQYVSAKLLEFDPVSLANKHETTLDSNTWSFALSNDGNYVLAKKFPGSGGGLPPDLLGSITSNVNTVTRIDFHSLEPVASGDGSKVLAFGDSQRVAIYDSAKFTWSSVISKAPAGVWNFPHTGSANLTGTRFASLGVVTDEKMNVIGQTPVGFQNSILSSDGSRLYVYDQDEHRQSVPVGKLRTYDVNSAPLPGVNGSDPTLVEIGSPIVLTDNPNGIYTTDSPVGIALTLDDRAMIICGVAGCVVQPTPP